MKSFGIDILCKRFNGGDLCILFKRHYHQLQELVDVVSLFTNFDHIVLYTL